MKKIKLTQGKVALVDDIDYEYLNQWKWFANKSGHTFYPTRHTYKGGKRTSIRMHQVLAERLGFEHKADHVNRNGLDNQRHNVRDATKKQNAENSRIPSNNTSGYKGVSWHKKASKWLAQIWHGGSREYLGLFTNKKDAISARKKAEREYFTHA